jgi:hypothetical protein
MISSSPTFFCKRSKCPSSALLLSYRRSGPESEERLWISDHLLECEFCGAELQLLREHPPGDVEECGIAEIPPSLRQLADCLLGDPSLALETLSEVIYERERLSLTDA